MGESRRLYEDRTNIVVKDIKDQPPGQYIAFVGTALGESAAVTCDGVAASPTMITLLQKSEKLSDKGSVPVCSFSNEVPWVILDASRVLLMTSQEWEASKVADNKSREKVLKGLFGEEGIAKVLLLPDGQQIALPAEPEILAKLKSAGTKKENPPVPSRGAYL